MATIVRDPLLSTFIHIPKTGGTSITDWLKENFNAQVSKGKKHCDIVGARNYFGDIGFTYCVVRNPWDLAVSWYFFRGRRAQYRLDLHDSGERIYNGKWGNRDYILRELDIYNQGFDNFILNYYNRKSSYSIAKDCDYIMKLETLNEDFKYIQCLLNCNNPLPHLNSTERNKDYQQYYNSDTQRVIAEKYAEDIENFGYSF